MNDDSISRQAAIDCVCYDQEYTIECLEKLPSAQPEQNNDLEFWRKRADYYSDLCMKLIREMGKGITIAYIIRCKDCAKHEYCRTSTVWAIPPKDDWYCADAERKTDG